MKRSTLIFPALGLALCAMAITTPRVAAEGEDRTTLCHGGVEITVADPAIINAHLDHGDCIGTCIDCEGRCCIKGGSSLVLTQYDCAQINGRFQYDKETPCFKGGD